MVMNRKGTEIKRLRVMAAHINQRLSRTQRYYAESRRKYWLRSFAAAALPIAMGRTRGRGDAINQACNYAQGLWDELERRLDGGERDDGESQGT